MEISFKFFSPLRQVDSMETEIYKYLRTIYFRVQRANMAENKRRKLEERFIFVWALKRRFSESQITIFENPSC